jgi:hypothetical protein
VNRFTAPPRVWIPAAAAAATLLVLLGARALEDTRRVTQLETELAATLRSLEVLRGDLERMTRQARQRAKQVASLRRALARREAGRPAPSPHAAPGPEAETPAAPPRTATHEPLVYARPAGVDAARVPQRSSGQSRSPDTRLPEVVALAPDHVGHTVTPRPTFYWRLSERTNHDLLVTLVDAEARTTLFEKRLRGPHRRGFGHLSLGMSGTGLKRDRVYQWSVSVLAGDAPGPDDPVAAGLVERVKKTPELEAELHDAGRRGAAAVYARRGLWYDALNAVSRRIASSRRDEALRAERDALLQQVGLDTPAS